MTRLATFLFFLAMSATSLTTAQTPVHVAIYYESLCPDSIKFITKQFYPTWKKMAKYMDVEFVPYGNSNTTKDNEGGLYTFECQHGPAECFGNKVQACALSHLTLASQKADFVNCMMAAKNTSAAGLDCATELNMDYKPIEACVMHSEGGTTLAKLGDKTKALSPPLKSVPTIVFNMKYTQDEQEKTMKDFMSALCSHISGAKPSMCSGLGAGASALVYAPSIVVALAVAVLASN